MDNNYSQIEIIKYAVYEVIEEISNDLKYIYNDILEKYIASFNDIDKDIEENPNIKRAVYISEKSKFFLKNIITDFETKVKDNIYNANLKLDNYVKDLADNKYFIDENLFNGEKLCTFKYIKITLLREKCDKYLIYKLDNHFHNYMCDYNIDKINYKSNIEKYINKAMLNLQKYTNV